MTVELKESLTMTTMQNMLKIVTCKSWHLSIEVIILEILVKNGKDKYPLRGKGSLFYTIYKIDLYHRSSLFFEHDVLQWRPISDSVIVTRHCTTSCSKKRKAWPDSYGKQYCITISLVSPTDLETINELFAACPIMKTEFLKPNRSSISLMLQFLNRSNSSTDRIFKVQAIEVENVDIEYVDNVYISWTSDALFLIGKNTTGCIAGLSASSADLFFPVLLTYF